MDKSNCEEPAISTLDVRHSRKKRSLPNYTERNRRETVSRKINQRMSGLKVRRSEVKREPLKNAIMPEIMVTESKQISAIEILPWQ